MDIEVANEAEMKAFGRMIGILLKGGEVIELIGDVGAGKTTLTKGIATGLDVTEDVQSPSFTISRTYDARDRLHVAHYDFYRLHDPGIMANELEETMSDAKSITIIEWAEIVTGILPKERLSIRIIPTSENGRRITLAAHGERYQQLAKELLR